MTLTSPRRLSTTIGALLVLVASLVTALVTAPPARAATGDMVISGVIDGPLPGGLPKAIELHAVNDIADLSTYGVGSANNGGGSDGSELELSGSASAGDFLYVATESIEFGNFFGFAPTFVSGSAASINGDDAIELFKDGAVVDVFGDINTDGTGEPWDYQDGWAYRVDGTGQDGASFELGNWTFSGPNALDGEATNATAATPFPLGTYTAGDGGGGGGGDDAADLLLTEIVVTPTAGEFVEIHNDGDSALDLSDVYLSDATFAGGGAYYYNIVTGTDAGGGGFGDFNARFPDGASIAAGEYQTVAMSGSAGFVAEYGTAPTYELFDDGSADGESVMREALPGSINGQGGLTNSGEVVVLYTWDGASDVVADLDYVVWGDKAEAVDKTGVATDGPDADGDATAYLPDTAISAQDVVAASSHANGESWQRGDLAEGTEAQSGGNGAAGSDETSENVSATWCTEAPTPGAAGACDGGGGGDDATPVFVHEVQGDGPASPLDGDLVEIQAVVTSLFTANDELDAFFVQEEDVDADSNPATSEGVFVFCRGFCPADLAVGDLVTVTGEVDEFFGMTQVEPAGADDIVIDGSGVALPAATAVALPAGGSTLDEATFESIEGMVVTFPGTLAVSEYFELARYGQLVLTADARPFQFTHDAAPSVDGYAAFLADLETRRIILDDDNNTQNDPINGATDEAYPYPTASWPDGGLSLDNYVRGGDTVDGLTGVMHWSFAGQTGTDAWRIRPIDGYDYTFTRDNPRTDAPDDVGGSLTVASFNVLNYFTSIDGVGTCQAGCRGADSDAEFIRQQDKIVSALAEIDADIVGLVEIENNDSAVANLVDALNAVVGADTYAAVETGEIGTDSIKVGFIHKTATVEAVGDHAILDSSVDPTFIDTKNRPALAQTFREVDTGGVFTAAVNHLKSKGSDCEDIGEDESIEDGQANCSQTRTEAAVALANWLASDPTGSGDEDAMILGDLNAYAMEDAIVALEDAGYTDLNEALGGDDAYTYVFDGQLGYLDYVMTNESLTTQVTGATRWHINADEVPVFDYNDAIQDPAEASFERESDALPIYAPDPYRSSDHDPVIVGLDLTPSDVTPPSLEVTVDPSVINQKNHKYVDVTATITVSDDFDDDVEVTLVSAVSDEPDNGDGDGNTTDDIVVLSDTEFKVRAERSGTGAGRTYTFTWEATDDAGNTSTASATVFVPLGRR